MLPLSSTLALSSNDPAGLVRPVGLVFKNSPAQTGLKFSRISYSSVNYFSFFFFLRFFFKKKNKKKKPNNKGKKNNSNRLRRWRDRREPLLSLTISAVPMFTKIENLSNRPEYRTKKNYDPAGRLVFKNYPARPGRIVVS